MSINLKYIFGMHQHRNFEPVIHYCSTGDGITTKVGGNLLNTLISIPEERSVYLSVT